MLDLTLTKVILYYLHVHVCVCTYVYKEQLSRDVGIYLHIDMFLDNNTGRNWLEGARKTNFHQNRTPDQCLRIQCTNY